MEVIRSVFPRAVEAFYSKAPLSFREDMLESKVAKKELKNKLHTTAPITWLTQVHGNNVLELPSALTVTEADAVFTRQKGTVCAVRTADCLPILISSTSGDIVAAIHAGWRGLHAEIIKKTLLAMNTDLKKLIVWLGPAICRKHFEVGAEVYEKFLSLSHYNDRAFIQKQDGKYLADLYEIAKIQLIENGVLELQIYEGEEQCTFHNQDFHSHRRDGEKSGRMVSLIYIK